MSRILGILVAFALGAFLTTPAAALACEPGFRPFKHFGGEDCIPVHPQRIVAPRHDRAATPLMDLGAPLIGAGFGTLADGTKYVRGATDIFGAEFVANYGLTPVGDGGSFDIEAVAALEPDLIILVDWELEEAEKTRLVAPTVVIPPNLPFLDHLAFLADAVGMKGAYEERLAAYRGKIEKIKALIGNPSAISVSRFDLSPEGLWYYPNWGAVDQVITDIGLSRPAIEAQATENLTAISFERLPEFDADILIASHAHVFGQTIEALTTQWDDVAPFWRDLPGVTAGRLYWYERDVWVGYTFKSLETAADGLLLLAAGRSD